MKSFSDAVTQGCMENMTNKSLEAVVKSVVNSDDQRKRVMIFGLDESENGELCNDVDDMLAVICSRDKATVKDCYRVGKAKQGVPQPVKVHFHSSEAADNVLRNASSLKPTSKYSKVFVSPDLSPEERVVRRKLVNELKEKIKREPQSYHYIRNGAICSRTKISASPPPSIVPATQPASSQPVSAPTPRATMLAKSDLLSNFEASIQSARNRRK